MQNDSAKSKVEAGKSKDEKELTKWERFAANANKIKVKGDKNKMLDGLGASLKE